MEKISEGIRPRVNVVIDVIDTSVPEGKILRQHRGHNLVVNSGLAVLAQSLASGNPNITTFRLGSGGTAVTPGDTTLETPVASFTPSSVSAAGAVTSIQHYVSSGSVNGSNLREAGLFVGSTLFARFVFNDPDLLPKTITVAVVFSWTVTFSAS